VSAAPDAPDDVETAVDVLDTLADREIGLLPSLSLPYALRKKLQMTLKLLLREHYEARPPQRPQILAAVDAVEEALPAIVLVVPEATSEAAIVDEIPIHGYPATTTSPLPQLGASFAARVAAFIESPLIAAERVAQIAQLLKVDAERVAQIHRLVDLDAERVVQINRLLKADVVRVAQVNRLLALDIQRVRANDILEAKLEVALRREQPR
jgi:hypothetical protein